LGRIWPNSRRRQSSPMVLRIAIWDGPGGEHVSVTERLAEIAMRWYPIYGWSRMLEIIRRVVAWTDERQRGGGPRPPRAGQALARCRRRLPSNRPWPCRDRLALGQDVARAVSRQRCRRLFGKDLLNRGDQPRRPSLMTNSGGRSLWELPCTPAARDDLPLDLGRSHSALRSFRLQRCYCSRYQRWS
jgi:hypothetical protein